MSSLRHMRLLCKEGILNIACMNDIKVRPKEIGNILSTRHIRLQNVNQWNSLVKWKRHDEVFNLLSKMLM